MRTVFLKKGQFYFLFCFLLVFTSTIKAQEKARESRKENIEMSEKTKDTFEYDLEYRQYLTKALSSFSSGNSFSSLGNFVSLSTTDESLKANVFLLNKESTSMYSFTLSAGYANGISAIVNEGKLNEKISFSAEYRILPGNKLQITDYDSNEREKLRRDIKELEEANDKEILKVIETLQSGIEDFSQNEELCKLSDSLDSQLRKLYANKKENKLRYSRDTVFQKDINAMEKRLLRYRKELDDKLFSKIDYDFYYDEVARLNEKKNEKKNEIVEKIDAIQAKVFHLRYLTLGYSATREDFTLFLPENSLDKQIREEDYVTQSFTIGYSLASNLKGVKNNSAKDAKFGIKRLLSGGVKFSLTNNIARLKKWDVVDSQIINDSTNRTLMREQNVLLGEYRKDIKGLTFYSDNYIFLNEKGTYAIHVNPEHSILEFQKPVTTIRLGILVPFKKLDEPKTKVNIELFYHMRDIFNNVLDEDSFQRRNQIGIQASFPFNF